MVRTVCIYQKSQYKINIGQYDSMPVFWINKKNGSKKQHG